MRAARAFLAAALLAWAGSARAAAEAVPEGFGSDARALEAWRALQAGHPIRSRELAQRLLMSEPGSFAAHCLLAQIQRRAEGDPARALHEAGRCRALFEARHGSSPGNSAPWFWHRLALHEQYAASEELELHARSLEHLDELERYHPGLVDAFRAWPLLNLGRPDAARAAARRALERRVNAVQVAKAWTALCALEAQAGDRAAAYDACREALATGPNPDDRAVRLVNLAEAARALGRPDETESLLREATGQFAAEALASPWLELVELYTSQARLPEAFGALREMRDWQRRQPLRIRAHSGARHERAAALLLLSAGRLPESVQASGRALAQPDRSSEVSSSRAQLELATAIVSRAACRAAADASLERASASALHTRPAAWLEAVRFAWCGWRVERRAAALLAGLLPEQARSDHRGLASLEIPAWIAPDAVAIAGPAVAESWLRQAAPGDRANLSSGQEQVWRAEIEARRGHAREALAHARRALEELPPAEVLLRARAALRAGEAAQALGESETAGGHFALVLALDGGALRRAGLALPVRLDIGPGPLAAAAARLLRRSPRLVPGANAALNLALSEDRGRASACVIDPGGTQLACAHVESLAGESPVEAARRLAAEFHARVFAPRVDWTQPDLRSLEGFTAAF